MRLAQTLQFAWFVGHGTLLLSALRYGLSYIFFNYYSKMAKFSYRLAFISAGVTYGIVVYKGFRARQKTGKPTSAIALLGDENVQYLGKSSHRLGLNRTKTNPYSSHGLDLALLETSATRHPAVHGDAVEKILLVYA